MNVNKKNIRIVCLISLVIGLFLPTLTIYFFGIETYFSLFDVILKIQSLSVLGDVGYVSGAAYIILLIYLSSICTCYLAILKDSEVLTFVSAIIVLIYMALVFLGVNFIKYKLAYTGNNSDPLSDAAELALSYMFDVGIGVGFSFLISLLLFGTLIIENDSGAHWKNEYNS